jgi:predicted permease
MIEIIKTSFPLFFIISIGFIIKKLKIANKNWINVLNKFVLYLGMPSIIIQSFITIQKIDSSSFFINSLIIFLMTFAIIILFKFIKIKKEIANAYIACSVVGNIAYFGFPYISSIIPNSNAQISLVITSFLIILLLFVIGYLEYMHIKKISSKFFIDIIKNPLIISVIIGFILFKTSITIPPFLIKTLSLMSGSATPVALISLGIFLEQGIKFDNLFFHALIISFVKLLVVPLTFFFIVKGNSNYIISIIESAMPVAITPFILTQIYPINKKVVLESIIISTIFSVITLPFITSLLI